MISKRNNAAVAQLENEDRERVVKNLGEGIDVVENVVTFPNLHTAVHELAQTLRNTEAAKIKAARIIDAIRRQELYREAQFDSFAAFLPVLLEQTAAIGWKSATTIKRYLAFVQLYLDGLRLNSQAAILAVSHLHELYVLAQVDRKSGELADPTKPGKLEPDKFEDIARLVTFMASAFSKEEMKRGLSAEELAPRLAEAGLTRQAETYKELMGRELVLPAKGGWTLAHTQEIIERVRSGGEECEDEEDDTTGKLTQVWVGHETFDKTIRIERIEFRDESGEAIEVWPINKTYSSARVKKLVGKNKLEIAGQDGEQNVEVEEEELEEVGA